jgi:photosystem II stability/assembly factor-like uncharacterized protein
MRRAAAVILSALAGAFALALPALGQPLAWQRQDSGSSAELRGLSVVDARVAWASGAHGTVLRTVDGVHWQARPVPQGQELDFRAVRALNASTAWLMSAGPGAASRIYRTDDGGASWRLLITNSDPNGFWDALAFWDADHGIVFGDPVGGRFQVLATADGGATWRAVADPAGLAALPDEGAFAASGTCLSVAGANDAWFITGGAAATRSFHSADRGRTWHAAALPIPAGAPSRGGFSVAFRDARVGLAAGGDYKEPALASLNGARSDDGGATWSAAPVLPSGFMSAVVPVPGTAHAFVAAGLAGSGVSTDDGRTWSVIDRTPVNAVGFALGAGWAVGPKGIVLKLTGGPVR